MCEQSTGGKKKKVAKQVDYSCFQYGMTKSGHVVCRHSKGPNKKDILKTSWEKLQKTGEALGGLRHGTIRMRLERSVYYLTYVRLRARLGTDIHLLEVGSRGDTESAAKSNAKRVALQAKQRLQTLGYTEIKIVPEVRPIPVGRNCNEGWFAKLEHVRLKCETMDGTFIYSAAWGSNIVTAKALAEARATAEAGGSLKGPCVVVDP